MDPGLLAQLFRGLLGPPGGQAWREGPQGGPGGQDGGPPGARREGPPMDDAELYRVFTDPAEMNRFLEEQIDDTLRNFGLGLFGGSLRSGPGGPWGGSIGLGGPPGDQLEALPAPGGEDRRGMMLKEGWEGRDGGVRVESMCLCYL